eukprot:NODE_107_length_18988_cov_0.534491.p6 type:complete len:291 gc:universal NODE_107_length_18988_cov_0.534491:7257-8129(+)
MVKIDPDDILNNDAFTYIGFALNSLCLIIGIVTVVKFVRETTRKKTYFYYAMVAIVIGSVLTSIIFFFQVICDSRSLKENVCQQWMLDLTNAMWQIAYLMMFALVISSTFKYTVLRTMNHWKWDLQPFLLLIGLFLYLSTSILRILATISYNNSYKYSIIALLLYTVIVDVIILGYLLKKLRDTRKICVNIPKNIDLAYYSTRNALVFILVGFPLLLVLFVLNSILWKDNSNMFNFLKYLIHFAVVVYFSLNVVSMILIKTLAEVQDCSSSFFGLDSTLVNESKQMRSLD